MDRITQVRKRIPAGRGGYTPTQNGGYSSTQREGYRSASREGHGFPLKRSTGTIVACILLFLVFFSAYSDVVLLKTTPATYMTKSYPTQTNVDGKIQTFYSVSLPQMANANKLSTDLMDPGVLNANATSAYQFLSLRWVEGITAADLAATVKGKGVLDGHEQDFWDAAKQYNLNPIYLIAHARVESGNGTSKLAKGVVVQAGTYTDTMKHTYTITTTGTYYNLFGINAFDKAPVKDGSTYAAAQNWDSVGAAILGGAKWISANYINRAEDMGLGYDQYTLYQMRYDPYGWTVKGTGKEYAIDEDWAKSISSILKQYGTILDGKPLLYDIPQYGDLV